MPCDYKKYHPAWKQLVLAIKRRAHDRCELCGVQNGKTIIRPDGNWWHEWYYADPEDIICAPTGARAVRIVLTVAHVDQDITNNNPWNLMALCQRCHLKIDLPWKIKNRSKK
jgi:5-methylcytosine-specific restriction endonuclease McrA